MLPTRSALISLILENIGEYRAVITQLENHDKQQEVDNFNLNF